MTLHSATSTRSWTRPLLAAVGLLLAFALDVPVMRWAQHRPPGFERLDVVQFFRCGGYAPLWFCVAAAVLLEDRRRASAWSWHTTRRAGTIAAAVIVAGLVAEIGKLAFRRERASLAHAWYQFRPIWEEPLKSGGLSMPSSHAMIAFAAAFAVGHHFRAARPVLILYAIGTAATRVATGAHFVSDVYVAFLLAHLVVGGLLRAFGPTSSTSVDEPIRHTRPARSPWPRRPLPW